MPSPTLETDGWTLDDGEELHAQAPASFRIPPRGARETLRPGDLAKLVFRIMIDDDEEPIAVERMWVIVRERIDGGYFGLLDNEPYALAENERLWPGTELPFEPRHVIDIQTGDTKSIDLTAAPPRTFWPRN